MNNNEFVYTTYIRTTPEELWRAITNPEFTRQYWGGHENISDWKKGAKWQHVFDSEKLIRVTGQVLESVPPKRLVLSWIDPQDTSDESRVILEIEAVADMVRLNIIHGSFKDGSIMAKKIVVGWPLVLSSLKSFLETGKAIDIAAVKSCSAKK